MTKSKPVSKPKRRKSAELPEDKLDKVQGGAVPFHRVINNTIYGDTQTTTERKE